MSEINYPAFPQSILLKEIAYAERDRIALNTRRDNLYLELGRRILEPQEVNEFSPLNMWKNAVESLDK